MRQQRIRLTCAVAIVLLAVVGACGRPAGPAASQAPAPGAGAAGAQRAPEATTPEWDAVVAAAKQEGVLVISTPTGASTYQRLHERIKREFPGLDVQATGMKACG